MWYYTSRVQVIVAREELQAINGRIRRFNLTSPTVVGRAGMMLEQELLTAADHDADRQLLPPTRLAAATDVAPSSFEADDTAAKFQGRSWGRHWSWHELGLELGGAWQELGRNAR
jgi:hypothetical protein